MALTVAALTALGCSASAAAGAPRVMSLNVCTDQLVLALAAPDQIASLSELSNDPAVSPLHRRAAAFPKNRGLAEEVLVARPDVVVTGAFTLHNTTSLMKRLGVRVEEFAYAQTLESIPADIRRMGEIVGHPDAAETLAAEFEADVEALTAGIGPTRPTAVVYGQNGVVLGAGTLADSLLRAAGFRNLAAERGFEGMAPYPLELLVRDRPDLVLLSEPYADAPALADRITDHPALRALGGLRGGVTVPRGAWACGGPFTIEALRALVRLREQAVRPAALAAERVR